jgi:hypothetical protein
MNDTAPNLQVEIESALKVLLGLHLSIARNAGNMKGFHFGKTTRRETGLVGQYALHIQCPWRLDSTSGVVTGSDDFYVRGDDNLDENWEPGTVTGHLQNQILAQLLGGYDQQTRSYISTEERLNVTSVRADGFGGFELELSGGYRIVVFPAGSRGEYWRLLSPGVSTAHVVVGNRSVRYE